MCESEQCEKLVREVLEKIQKEKEEYVNEYAVKARMQITVFCVMVVLSVCMLLAVFAGSFREILLGGLIIIAAGFYFYAWRLKYRLIYGVIEVIFGLVSVLDGIFKINVFSIGGGFYVIVRGFDNISQGIADRRYKQVWDGLLNDILGVKLDKKN